MTKTDALKSYETVPLHSLEVEKAGFVIYGKNRDGQLCVLASYVQGRFDDSANKFYCLAKGAIDPDESPIEAACRETHEETGIDVAGVLGEKNLQKLVSQQDITFKKHELPANPYGLKIKRAYSQPTDFAYVSGSGKPRRLQTFFLEVENIDVLDQCVKMPPASETEKRTLRRIPGAERFTSEAPDLEHTVGQHVKKQHYPDLKDMLGILRSGKLGPTEKHGTNRRWIPKKEITLIEHSSFAPLEQRWIKDTGRTIEHITDANDWQEFCADIEEKHRADYKALQKDFSTLKGYFSSTGICGDRTCIKLDEKDRPLNFFFEGGEVLPLHKFLQRASHMADTNKLYRDAMWGEYQGPSIDPRTGEQIAFSAQIGGILPRDGQGLRFSEVYSTEAARAYMHNAASFARWGNQDNAANRVDRLATVLDYEAVSR